MLKNKSNAFTLIELLVAMSIIAILVLLSLPLYNNYIKHSKSLQITHDIKSMEKQADINLMSMNNNYESLKDNKRDLENHAHKGYLHDKRGRVEKVDVDKSFKVVPKEWYSDINTRLDGSFYIDERSEVVYKENTFPENPLSEIENYAITYSLIDKGNIENIKRYDMAILEPFNISSNQVEYLESYKTKTYGYQTIFEVDQTKLTRDKVVLGEEDYLYVNGEKQVSPYYNHYYGDIRSSNYREYLFGSIEKNIISKGFTGVFFDTLDDFETSHKLKEAMSLDENPNIESELLNGYITFFKELDYRYPELSIILNRAFNSYNLGLGEYSDGIMYEDLDNRDFENPATAEYYKKTLVKPLNKTALETDGVILGLSYREKDANYHIAQRYNWLYFYYDANNNRGLHNKEEITPVKITR